MAVHAEPELANCVACACFMRPEGVMARGGCRRGVCLVGAGVVPSDLGAGGCSGSAGGGVVCRRGAVCCLMLNDSEYSCVSVSVEILVVWTVFGGCSRCCLAKRQMLLQQCWFRCLVFELVCRLAGGCTVGSRGRTFCPSCLVSFGCRVPIQMLR